MTHERLINKQIQPTDEDMVATIGPILSDAWIRLREFLVRTYGITPILNYGGPRYGWNLEHYKGKRPLCEMYPEHGSFTALVILGKNELSQAMSRLSSFGNLIQKALIDTPRYHDGCWMYIQISDPDTCLQDELDIEQLIMIKKKPPKIT
ncbi:MAG TPA: DUF3788 domain-containing protein [Anaerolineaceae bacterium]